MKRIRQYCSIKRSQKRAELAWENELIRRAANQQTIRTGLIPAPRLLKRLAKAR